MISRHRRPAALTRFGLFVANRSTKIVGQYDSRYGKFAYDLDAAPAPALPRGQVGSSATTSRAIRATAERS